MKKTSIEQNKYMRNYWATHKVKYDMHKSRVIFNQQKKRFIKKIEVMENMIYAYLYKLELKSVEEINRNAASGIQSPEYQKTV